MTKSLGTDLIIGESVRPLLGDCFILRRLGLVQLKGKTKPAFIYEVLAENRDSNDPGSRWEDITLYEQGLDDFFNRRFQEAATAFEKCAKRKPGDASILYYLKACSEFQAAPPPSNWDGRIVMETK
jgi:adenylate cyclase